MNVQYGSRSFGSESMGLLGFLNGSSCECLRRLCVRQVSMGLVLDDLGTAFMKHSS